uniref:Uncharacterized protein n=1 Tax=Trypanosoma vivax (strain Y486) TaxID=1055687 RepID=G0TSR9_TRYVY|nr:hypothetical protein TVY486_0301840 [Trypanosoma vivax Y486]
MPYMFTPIAGNQRFLDTFLMYPHSHAVVTSSSSPLSNAYTRRLTSHRVASSVHQVDTLPLFYLSILIPSTGSECMRKHRCIVPLSFIFDAVMLFGWLHHLPLQAGVCRLT